MKPKEPDFITRWRDNKRAEPPACCHTCDWYTEQGYCDKFKAYPPEDFAATINVCPDWEEEIPF